MQNFSNNISSYFCSLRSETNKDQNRKQMMK